MQGWKNKDVLVISPAPSLPRNYGNRLRIHRICERLKEDGARVHFLLYPAEADWRHRLPLATMAEMTQGFTSFHIAPPSRGLHEGAMGTHHTADEWWDPALGQYIDWLVRLQRFDAAIVNYTWLSQALLHLPESCLKILDTHDRFSGRKELFLANGLEPEFFYLTEEEEAKALSRADVVWAIKREEADFFRALTAKPVFTVPHVDPVRRLPTTRSDFLRVGIIGANNNLNRENFETFLDDAVAHVRQHLTNFELVVAGSVCKTLRPREEKFIRFLGYVDQTEDFYAQVDCVVVPMRFSTGLKIKTAEALSFAKPVIALAHAFEGFHPTHEFHTLDSNARILEAIAALARAPGQLKALEQASLRSAKASEQEIRAGLALTLAAHEKIKTPAFWIFVNADELRAQPILADHALETADFLRHQLPVGFVFTGPGLPDEDMAARLSGIGRLVVLGSDEETSASNLPASVTLADGRAVLDKALGGWLVSRHGAALFRQLPPGTGFVPVEALTLSLAGAPSASDADLAALLRHLGAGQTFCASRLDADLLPLLAREGWDLVLLPFLRGGWAAAGLAHLRSLAPQIDRAEILPPVPGPRARLDTHRAAALRLQNAGPDRLARRYALDPLRHPGFLVEYLLRTGGQIELPDGTVWSHDDQDQALREDSGWARIWVMAAALKSRLPAAPQPDIASAPAFATPEVERAFAPEGIPAPGTGESGPTLGFTRLSAGETLSGREAYVSQLLVYRPGGTGPDVTDLQLTNLDVGQGAIQRLVLRFARFESAMTLTLRRNDCSPDAFREAASVWQTDDWGDYVVYDLGTALTPLHDPALEGEDRTNLLGVLHLVTQLRDLIGPRLGGGLLDSWRDLSARLAACDLTSRPDPAMAG